MGGVQEDVYDGPEEGGGRGLEIARERVTVLYGRLCVDHLDVWGRQTLSFKRFRVLSVLPQTHFRRKSERGGAVLQT